ncbi:hypothetical protein ACFWVM_08685 [Nocardia fluminea]|uniref:hypothetical protein n=1 Tax=Nocardia fluminea TaxID=134984 RepID=UPI00365A0824
MTDSPVDHAPSLRDTLTLDQVHALETIERFLSSSYDQFAGRVNGSSKTPPVTTSLPCARSATTSKPASGTCWPNSTSPPADPLRTTERDCLP